MNITLKTKGHTDIIDLTAKVGEVVKRSKINNGFALVFVTGSTAAITTLEYEVGVISDMKETLDKLILEEFNYHHHQKWGDRNGAAHLKAAIIGPDLLLPIGDSALELGRWQQIVLIDFDERPREREIIVKCFNASLT